MHIVIAGFIVGILVGLTGSGGGALMTPILILLFGVTPSAAVSSDIVASAIMKPFGGAIHFRRGTVHGGLVLWLSIGSVPAAFAGVFIDHALGSGPVMQTRIEYAMGAALIIASAALIYRLLLDSARARRSPAPGGSPASGGSPGGDDEPVIAVRRALTVAVGVFGGLLVGITSVGSGSLMIVLLMMLYPQMSMRRLVGTDIVQSMPLVGSAAIAHALFGNLEFGLSLSIAIGSIPGVIIGSLVSARASNFLLRPILAVVLGATALKLLGLGTDALAVTVAVFVAVGLPLWAALDGRGWPDRDWQAAGYRRRRWLTAMLLGAPVVLGLVTAVIYFARVRSRLAAVATSEIPPRAPVAAAGSAGTPRI
ncbi:MAG TPA: sulfite exporter TauE/SafE family protein [Streptosporangiaceae bacterium]|jgi:hypothetical protein|nr:sulfite exporter TauE/SafE family protein [Streptosporangiaceae bacterium]